MDGVAPLVPAVSSPWWHQEFALHAGTRPLPMAAAAFALSGHGSDLARDPADLVAVFAQLHDLANGVATFDEWRHRLFVDAGFTGNGAEYHDARNSFLPDVLARRLGLPITLALVGRLVAELAGLASWGIGMPGHFLLAVAEPGTPAGDWAAPGTRIVDAFNGGRVLTLDDAASQFRSMFGPSQRFDPGMLAPTPDAHVLIRMLNNLKSNYARERRLDALCSVARLRTCLPEWTLDEGRELLRLLTVNGALDEATDVLDQLDYLFPNHPMVLADERARLAASLN